MASVRLKMARCEGKQALRSVKVIPRSPGRGVFYQFKGNLSRFQDENLKDVFDRSVLVYNTRYARWRILGTYFGYNACCIQYFISHDAYPERFPKIAGPWIGTGFLPCCDCAAEVNARGRLCEWRTHFFKHRAHYEPFPLAGNGMTSTRELACAHWVACHPFWRKMANLVEVYCTRSLFVVKLTRRRAPRAPKKPVVSSPQPFATNAVFT